MGVSPGANDAAETALYALAVAGVGVVSQPVECLPGGVSADTGEPCLEPLDLWAGIAGGVAGAGATYLAQTPDTRQRVHNLFTTRAAEAVGPAGALTFRATAAYVLALAT